MTDCTQTGLGPGAKIMRTLTFASKLELQAEIQVLSHIGLIGP